MTGSGHSIRYGSGGAMYAQGAVQVGTAVVCAVVAGVTWFTRDPGTTPPPLAILAAVVLVWLFFSGMAILLSEVVADSRGLELRKLVRSRSIPWAHVEGMHPLEKPLRTGVVYQLEVRTVFGESVKVPALCFRDAAEAQTAIDRLAALRGG